MKKSPLHLAVVTIPLLLGGCVAVWGGSYQVESKTPEAMVINYDTNFIDNAEIEKLAREHCQNYHKTALLQTHDKDMMEYLNR